MYTDFALVYDRLMRDVNYNAWSNYYQQILSYYNVSVKTICECACGTGNITLCLAKNGFQMIGVDNSPDMLFQASQKSRKASLQIPFINQNMTNLQLHRPVDSVLCTNDGLNYLKNEDELYEFFTRAKESLKPGGILSLDLSTPYKLKYVLGNNCICEDAEDFSFHWQNEYHEDKASVDMFLSIFIAQKNGLYQRLSELQVQYAHSKETIETALKEAGFHSIKFFGNKNLEEPLPNETRWFIAAKKY